MADRKKFPAHSERSNISEHLAGAGEQVPAAWLGRAAALCRERVLPRRGVAGTASSNPPVWEVPGRVWSARRASGKNIGVSSYIFSTQSYTITYCVIHFFANVSLTPKFKYIRYYFFFEKVSQYTFFQKKYHSIPFSQKV